MVRGDVDGGLFGAFADRAMGHADRIGLRPVGILLELIRDHLAPADGADLCLKVHVIGHLHKGVADLFIHDPLGEHLSANEAEEGCHEHGEAGDTPVLLSDLEYLGVTVEEVKPKFEDLPAGYYALPFPKWGTSLVFSKTPDGDWTSNAVYSHDPEVVAQGWFEKGDLKPLTWAEATE